MTQPDFSQPTYYGGLTLPSGATNVYGTNRALLNTDVWISYIGPDGTVWYLAGPAAPLDGPGVLLSSHMGLMAPLNNLELKGARQDGSTYTGSVYDPTDIMLKLEVLGNTPWQVRNTMRRWIDSWAPSNEIETPGIMSVFTPEYGEWWAYVRMAKTMNDQMVGDFSYTGHQSLTWEAKNYDSFWYGPDSTSQFQIAYNTQSVSWGSSSNATTLGGSWTQFYSPSGLGTVGVENGTAQWLPGGTTAVTNINVFNSGSATNNQVVSVTLSGATWNDFFSGLSDSWIDVWGRLNSAGTSGIRFRIGNGLFKLSYMVGGTVTDWFTLPLFFNPVWGDTYTLICGTATSPYNIVIQRNGFTIWNFTDTAQVSTLGSSNRLWGWGLGIAVAVLGGQSVPIPLASWQAADNLAATQSGTVPLTNIGTVDGWPRFVCYGPGTFTFNNGPGSTTPITFGPLLDGQIALVTTDPRLPSVVDLTPNLAPQVLNPGQQLLEQLISLATNGNTPPMLQQFESLFGILPPQGSLYSLLSGRFSNPYPGATTGQAPQQQSMAVSITNGGPLSKIVAGLTPMRRWPL